MVLAIALRYLMKRIKSFLSKIKIIFHFHEWPLSIHIFSLITVLFLLLILLQQGVSYNIFNNFYLKTQIESLVEEVITPYINDLKNNETTIEEFNQNHFAFSFLYYEGAPIPNNVESIIPLIDFEKESGSYMTEGDTKYANNVAFVNKIDDDNYVITIFSIQTTDKMLNTLNTYNFYVYVFIFIVICLSAWYIGKFIAKPIENITEVANDISNLDFSQKANEFGNRETTQLSKSINLLNDNLKQTIEELNIKNQEANELAQSQQKQFQMKKQLVSSISHELKTPLAIMQASISGILDGIFEPEENEAELQNVLKEINHTNEIVQEVLDVYRLDNDSFSLEIETLDLVFFTQKIINSFETVLKNANAKISFFYDERNIKIDGDYRQLKRVISNLFVNAIKYSPEYQTVDVSITRQGEKILFSVTNYGVTIPEEDIKNVFEPFYRVDKTGNRTEKRKGSGLGLYIVREILEKHHFEYGIKNIENGVTFYFIANEKK